MTETLKTITKQKKLVQYIQRNFEQTPKRKKRILSIFSDLVHCLSIVKHRIVC